MISLELREGNSCFSTGEKGGRGVLLVLGVALVLVLVRSLAAADTFISVQPAEDQLQLAVPLDLELLHAPHHRRIRCARMFLRQCGVECY